MRVPIRMRNVDIELEVEIEPIAHSQFISTLQSIKDSFGEELAVESFERLLNASIASVKVKGVSRNLQPGGDCQRQVSSPEPSKLAPPSFRPSSQPHIDLPNYVIQGWKHRGKRIIELSLQQLKKDEDTLLPIDKVALNMLLGMKKPKASNIYEQDDLF